MGLSCLNFDYTNIRSITVDIVLLSVKSLFDLNVGLTLNQNLSQATIFSIPLCYGPE